MLIHFIILAKGNPGRKKNVRKFAVKNEKEITASNKKKVKYYVFWIKIKNHNFYVSFFQSTSIHYIH
jgi:hypothetical protein